MLTPALSIQDTARLTNAGLHLVLTSAALTTDATGIGAIIDWAKLEPAPQSPRLLVNFSSGRVHAYGRSVTLSHQLAPVFRRLVEKAQSDNPVASGPEVEFNAVAERLHALRKLYSLARQTGALGADRAVAAISGESR